MPEQYLTLPGVVDDATKQGSPSLRESLAVLTSVVDWADGLPNGGGPPRVR